MIDAAEPVTKSCLECHLEMHGQPLETAGQGRVAGECLGCHQGLHAQPVRSFVFEGKITFRRALDGFEPGREYEGRLKLKSGNIYLYPERHLHINPGRLTGLRFVKEEKGYHLFTVFMARGQKLDSVEVTFPEMEFEAGGRRAVFGPAAVGELWLKLGGAYADAAQYDQPAPRPRESGPGGGGQWPLSLSGSPMPKPPLGPAAEPPGEVAFNYKLEKARPYHFLTTLEGRRIGGGSNQIALWIEDENGYYVATVFATRMAARQGHRFNPDTLPLWRSASKWDSATREEMAVVAGATQAPGAKTLIWDCRDWQGNPVRPGVYAYRLEANLEMQNRGLWSGRITLGDGENSSTATPRLFPPDTKSYVWLKDLRASFQPARRK